MLGLHRLLVLKGPFGLVATRYSCFSSRAWQYCRAMQSYLSLLSSFSCAATHFHPYCGLVAAFSLRVATYAYLLSLSRPPQLSLHPFLVNKMAHDFPLTRKRVSTARMLPFALNRSRACLTSSASCFLSLPHQPAAVLLLQEPNLLSPSLVGGARRL